jgi:hypothetical protein
MPCPHEFNAYAMQSKFRGNVKDARLKSKSRRPLQIQRQRQTQLQHQRRPAEAGRYKFKSNSDGNGVLLDFCAHAAHYVVYCDVADGMLRGVYYCEAAQIVFVEQFEDFFIVCVGRYG